MSEIGERVLREFKGDGVWRDQEGKIWTPMPDVVAAVDEARAFWLEQLPSRDDIADVIEHHAVLPTCDAEEAADAVLAAIRQAYEANLTAKRANSPQT